jgi:Tfp pilus assembly protein PilV
VVGLDSKRLKEKGVTLIEALISTVIVGIGFAAVFQMVSYSVQSIDISGERTKTNYLVAMVAEDILGDSNTEISSVKFYNYLIDKNNRDKQYFTSWSMGKCSDGTASSTSYNNAKDNKFQKWDNRFSEKRIKCKGEADKKSLKVYDICKNNCRYKNDTTRFIEVNGSEKLIIGKMEVNLNNGTKRKYLYFTIH